MYLLEAGTCCVARPTYVTIRLDTMDLSWTFSDKPDCWYYCHYTEAQATCEWFEALEWAQFTKLFTVAAGDTSDRPRLVPARLADFIAAAKAEHAKAGRAVGCAAAQYAVLNTMPTLGLMPLHQYSRASPSAP